MLAIMMVIVILRYSERLLEEGMTLRRGLNGGSSEVVCLCQWFALVVTLNQSLLIINIISVMINIINDTVIIYNHYY